jgi:hypothetical protein
MYELESSESKSSLEKRSQGLAKEDDSNYDDGDRSDGVILPPVEDIACVDGDSLAGDTADNTLGVKAPSHYIFYGMFSFICFGPLSTNFSATLAFGTPLTQTVAERKENSRAAQRLKEIEHRDVERSIGLARGMDMQGKFTMGLIAQKEDDADREDRQLRFLALTKKIDASQKLLDTMVLIADKTSASAQSAVWTKITDLTEKIESMLEELEEQKKPTNRVTNPIVSRVLEQASASIGVDLRSDNAVSLTEGVHNVDIENEDSGSFPEFLNNN